MSRPENDALLAGIIAHPQDDDRRLIYADWLDEAGDPIRAEFIRVQVRLAAGSPADDDYPDLLERKREVLSELWTCGLPEPTLPDVFSFFDDYGGQHKNVADSRSSYYRGFPFFATEPRSNSPFIQDRVRAFRDALPELVARTTIRGLNLFGWWTQFLKEILDCPAAGYFSALRPSKEAWHSTSVADAIVSSPIGDSLRWLDMRGSALGEGELRTLADAGVLGRLNRLEASVCCHPETLPGFAEGGGLSQLRHFEGVLLDDRQEQVIGGDVLSRLPQLHTLESPRPDWVANSGGFESLGALHLQRGERSMATALAASTFPKLACLTLGCGMRNDDLAALCSADWFANLRVLSLARNEIGDKGIMTLTKNPSAAELRILRLGDNKFGKQGLTMLAKESTFPRLTTLDLASEYKRKVSADDVSRFLTALSLPRLRHLNLKGWPVGDAGVKALADNPACERLRVLDLRDCDVGAEGAAALFASAHLRRLVYLGLDGNNPIGASLRALHDPAVLPELCECALPSSVSGDRRKRLAEARKTSFQ